jgi:hypothetical protein
MVDKESIGELRQQCYQSLSVAMILFPMPSPPRRRQKSDDDDEIVHKMKSFSDQ